MSGDPWSSSQQVTWSSGFDTSDSAFPGASSSTTQTQLPPASTGWVSFDDDAGGFNFAPVPAAAAALPHPTTTGEVSSAVSWTPSFSASTEPPVPSSRGQAGAEDQVIAQRSVQGGALSASTVAAPNAAVGVLPPVRDDLATTFTTPSMPDSRNGIQEASGSLSPAGGRFGSPVPGATAVAPGPSHGGPADPTVAAPVHRLPRPPTSASRGATGTLNAAGPPDGPPAHGGSSGMGGITNSASFSTKPTIAMSGSRNLDPFADLSLKPQLPRPPPMAAARGGPSFSIEPTQAAPDAKVATQTASARAGLERSTVPLTGVSATQAATFSDQSGPAPASLYPSFANLRLQPASLQSKTGAVAPAGSMRNVVETSAFDPFTSPSSFPQPMGPPGQSLSNQKPAGARASAAHQSGPPPPYSAAASMPSASLPSPPPYNVAGAELTSPSSPRDLPPPPLYIDALDMPSAQPQGQPQAGALPPPSYEESFTLPTADVRPGGSAAQPAAAAWAVFDEMSFPGNTGGTSSVETGIELFPSIARKASPIVSTTGVAQPFNAPPPPAPPPPLPSQICVEVRLPPLKPKEAACPRRLVAGMGMAFAAPGGDNVPALQWCLHPGLGHGHENVSGEGDGEATGPHFVLPPGASVPRTCEDWDSAPAAALTVPASVPDVPAACCMLLDDVSGALWTGHKDGRVVRWSVGRGRAAAYDHHWKAHQRGKITCMTLTPWGELWTASSAGTIRSWQYQHMGAGNRPPIRIFECRRARLTLGPNARANAQRAHSKTRLLALGPSGRVVWSAGRTGLVLWGAYDGEFLGTLTPGVASDGRAVAVGGVGGVYAGDTGAMVRENSSLQQMEINPQMGLESALINRPFVARVLLESGEELETGDQDIGQQVFKGLAGAAKLAARLGKKIRQNFANDGAVGAAEAYGSNEPGFGGGPTPGPRGKVVALVPGLHQSMYVAFQGGWLEKYTEWGRLIWSREYGRGVLLHSATLVGSQLWLGCADGFIRTATASTGDLGRTWKAHVFPVVALAHDAGSTSRGSGSGLVYSLSENGSVRAWPAVMPSEAHLLAWRDGLLPCLRRHQLTVLAATWNVNETRPSPQSLRRWLEPAVSAEIVSIALQEVEVGTSSVARDAAINLLSKGMLERGNQNAQWWASELAAALACTGHAWARVALRQMSGLVVVVFCRAELQQHVGEVATANVACGVMGVGGNKGAVAVSMSVFRRRLMFVSSHFAAHQERVDERNENYNKIVRQLHFENTSKAAQRQRQQQQQQQQAAGGPDVSISGRDAGGAGLDVDTTDPDADSNAVTPTTTTPVAAASAPMHRTPSGTLMIEMADDGHGPGMADAAMLVWSGDFNYRIRGSYAEVCELACARDFATLFSLDQCRQEMEKGTIFRGLREPIPLGHPVFVPTYKYDKGEPYMVVNPTEPGGRVRLRLPFDTSEKQRVPAWTDRVFYRGSRPGSLDVAEEEVQVSIGRPTDYNCVLEVNDSDHKPVYALLQVQLPAYMQEQKRRHSLGAAVAVHSAALAANTAAAKQPLQPHPVRLSTAATDIRANGVATVELAHNCVGAFRVQVVAERPSDGAPCPLPCWLEISPTTFVIASQERSTGDNLEGPQGRTRLVLRALPIEGPRTTEAVQLRFTLQPLWGADTRAGVLGPTLSVTLKP